MASSETNKKLKTMSEEYDSIDNYLANVEKEILVNALEKNRCNKTATAKELGISFRQLRYKLSKLEIE